jgi:hypothetical protein
MAKLEFEALDMNEIGAEAARANADPKAKKNNGNYFIMDKDGFCIMRFLPKLKGGTFCQASRIHALKSGQNKRQFHCTRVRTVKPDGRTVWMPPTDGTPDCCICRMYNRLYQKHDNAVGKEKEALKKQALELRPYERYYFNIIVREYLDPNTKKIVQNAGPLILSVGKELYAKIYTAMVGDAKHGVRKLGDISNPVSGREFRYVKKTTTGSGGMTYPTYDLSTFEDQAPLGTDDEIQDWLSKLHNLPALRKLSDEESMKKGLKVHLGLLPPNGNEDDFDYSEFEGGGGGGDDGDVVAEHSHSNQKTVAREEPAPAKKPLVKQEKVEKKPAPAAAPLDLAADPDFAAELDKLDNE